MSLNQRSLWPQTHQQQNIFSATPACLELVPDRASDLELCTTEILRRTQEELQWYRSLYENTPTVYFSLDVTGKIVSVNQFGANCLGHTPEQLIQKSVFHLFAQSDQQRLSDAFMEFLSASLPSETTNWEFSLDCPGSKITWVKVRLRMLPSQEQNPLHEEKLAQNSVRDTHLILMVCEDITENKQVEDAFRESEQSFQAVVNHAPVMLWMNRFDGLFTFFNQSWLKFTGRSTEQQQEGWLEQIHPQEQSFYRETYDSAFNAQTKFELEYRLKRYDGEYRWMLDTGIPRFTPSGQFIGYVGCCIDITERKLAEIALQKSQAALKEQLEEMQSLNRLKEEFISTVSHELCTPLTNMKMAMQMLGIALSIEHNFLLDMAKPQAERSKAARYFEILNNECEREINLINNFLDLHRLDPKAKPWILETIRVQQWLERLLERFKTHTNNLCNQNLRLWVAPQVPPLLCNPLTLERILRELLTNACKFSPADAEIIISAQLKSQNIEFQVINYGVEIPDSELPRIFEKFYRIPTNDPWKQGGTGLGLALVKKLTNNLGGTIEVESSSNRTCFTIQLALSSGRD